MPKKKRSTGSETGVGRAHVGSSRSVTLPEIPEEVKKASINMDSLKFDPVKHAYTWNTMPMRGVTTVLKSIGGDKTGALIQWAANEAIKYVKENLKTLEDLDSVLIEAKYAHKKNKESAGSFGTDTHQWIEKWIENSFTAPHENPLVERSAAKFREWASKNEVVFHESEKMVCNPDPEYFVAGTLDFVVEIPGKGKFMGDLKTSSGIRKEYFIQCAAYRWMYEIIYGQQDFVGSVIIRCGKDGKFEEKFSFAYEQELEMFKAALTLHKGLSTF